MDECRDATYDKVEFGAAGLHQRLRGLSFAGECGLPKLNLPILPLIGFNRGPLLRHVL
jgi:hypothetical protein